VPLQRPSEMISRVQQARPDVLCISALPPFALLHAKAIYNKLHTQLPDLKIFVGLWNYPGDIDRIAARLQLAEGSKMASTLSEVVNELAGPAEPAPQEVSESSV
jgi:hypothetical protein